jgi:hypothetical protein
MPRAKAGRMFKVFATHPYLASAIATWAFNNIVTVLVSSLPAPTKDASPRYVYWFKVTNTIIGNIKRAQSTALEDSPNWQAAVQAHLDKLAQLNSSPSPSPNSPNLNSGAKP